MVGSTRQHDELPLRMQVQIDLVNHHEPVQIDQGGSVRATLTHVVEEVPNPPDVGTESVRQCAERNIEPAVTERVIPIEHSASKARVLRQQLVSQRFDFVVPLAVGYLKRQQPCLEGHQRRLLLEEAGDPVVTKMPNAPTEARIHLAGILDGAGDAVADKKKAADSSLYMGSQTGDASLGSNSHVSVVRTREIRAIKTEVSVARP